MKNQTIQLGHGGGGLLSKELIDSEIVSRFGDGPLKGLPDGAKLPSLKSGIVFSTDSFVVNPMFFPGGNVGDLAVHGTVNDIAVSGGTPRWLSLGLIIEEGLKISVLGKVLDSVKIAAADCGVVIATGDTKVVSKGQCDGLYINTSGIGEVIEDFDLDPSRIQPGDLIVASGNLGDHGMAVMAAREGLSITASNNLVTDSAPVHRLVKAIVDLGVAGETLFMRDPTRGGAAATLNEVVGDTEVGILLKEPQLPFSREAKGLAEVLGFDLLHVASEGRMLLICRESVAPGIVDEWRKMDEGRNACVIGQVTSDKGRVLLETAIGGKRLVDVPQGELLPRIC